MISKKYKLYNFEPEKVIFLVPHHFQFHMETFPIFPICTNADSLWQDHFISETRPVGLQLNLIQILLGFQEC